MREMGIPEQKFNMKEKLLGLLYVYSQSSDPDIKRNIKDSIFKITDKSNVLLAYDSLDVVTKMAINLKDLLSIEQ